MYYIYLYIHICTNMQRWDSTRAHGRNGKIFSIIETARRICMALVSSGTLNYRKVNLSGGLAIGEFTSSIIKLLPLGGGGGGGGGVARPGGGPKMVRRDTGAKGMKRVLVEIKCGEYDHTR
jgi:hypothetical protein